MVQHSSHTMKGSAQNTREGRVRVSYVDDAEIIEKIEEMAKKGRRTASYLLREATWLYVAERSKKKKPTSS